MGMGVKVQSMGTICVLLKTRDESGTVFLRCNDAICGKRDSGSDLLASGAAMGDRQNSGKQIQSGLPAFGEMK